jgi:hypothetical protein
MDPSGGIRTQFLRVIGVADEIGIPIQLLYYPPHIIVNIIPLSSSAGNSRATLEWDITSRYSDTIGLGTEL